MKFWGNFHLGFEDFPTQQFPFFEKFLLSRGVGILGEFLFSSHDFEKNAMRGALAPII
jgi:hypothetical protein